MQRLFTGNDVIQLYIGMIGAWPSNDGDRDANEMSYIFDQNCIGVLHSEHSQEPVFNFRQAISAMVKAKARRDLILAGRWTPETKQNVEMIEDLFISVDSGDK